MPHDLQAYNLEVMFSAQLGFPGAREIIYVSFSPWT